MISDRLYHHSYGDGSRNGTLKFYSWLRADLRPDMRILNFGAGPATCDPARILEGQVVGADIDPIVLQNQEIDEARLMSASSADCKRDFSVG